MKKRHAFIALARLLTLITAIVLIPTLIASKAAAQGSLAITELGPRGAAIPIVSWSWGNSQSGSFHVGSGGGAGKANFQDVTITKQFDETLPIFLRYTANGDHFGGATLSWGPVTLKMTNVLVTSYEVSSEKLQEKITLNFAKVDVTVPRSTSFCWDIAENKSCQ